MIRVALVFLFHFIYTFVLFAGHEEGLVLINNPADEVRTHQRWFFNLKDDISFKNPDLKETGWNLASLETVWDGYPKNGLFNGIGWFRLHFYIEKPFNLGLMLPLSNRGVQIYVNGILIRETRPYDEKGRSPPTMGMPSFTSISEGIVKKGKNVIAIRAGSLNGIGGFISSSAYLGGEETVRKRWHRFLLWYGSMAFIALFLAVYFTMHFFNHRAHLMYRSFALLCGAVFLWIIGYSGIGFFLLDHYIVYGLFSYLGGILCMLFLLEFIFDFFSFKGNYIKWTLQGLIVVIVVFLFYDFVSDKYTAFNEKYLFFPFMGVSALVPLYILYLNLVAMRQKKLYAGRFLIGQIIILITVIYSVLVFTYVIQGDPLTIEGFFLMTLVFAAILASRQAQVHRDLEQAHRRLVVLDKMKDEFLASTSHELKTPLHGIMGLTEGVLEDPAVELPPRHAENLELVRHSARRLSLLVEGILDFSRLRAGRVDLLYEEIRLDDLLKGTVSLARGLCGDKPLELRCMSCENIPPVTADRKRLEQILLNLLSNAVKFTEKGEITVWAEEDRGGVAINVRDTGRGIEPSRVQHIWDPYVQLDPTDSREHGGAGLGLAISKYLAGLHGGDIWVQSEYGAGSVFTVWLPPVPAMPEGLRVPVREAPKPAAETILKELKPVEPASAAGAGYLLVVDDDVVNLRIAGDILSGRGYSVQTAMDGPTALAMIRKETPDLVVLDIMLPGMSGYEVARKVREEMPERYIPIIMVTARTGLDDMVKGFSFGGNDYIMKPFGAKELLARVENQLVIRNFIHTEMKVKEHLAHEKSAIEQTALERSRTLHEAITRMTEWERIIAQDLNLTRAFLDRLMSKRVRTAQVNYALLYEPLYTVGGDVYDLHEYSPGRIRLFLADTTGHGIKASLNTINIMTEYELLRDREIGPGEILEELNGRFCRKAQESRVVFTCCVAEIDCGANTVRLASAGHPAQFLVYGGAVRELKPKGPVIGFKSNMRYGEETAGFDRGALLFMYTDGLIEDEYPRKAGLETERRTRRDVDYLKKELVGCALSDVDKIPGHMKAAMKGNGYKARRVTDDDLTVIAVKRLS